MSDRILAHKLARTLSITEVQEVSGGTSGAGASSYPTAGGTHSLGGNPDDATDHGADLSKDWGGA